MTPPLPAPSPGTPTPVEPTPAPAPTPREQRVARITIALSSALPEVPYFTLEDVAGQLLDVVDEEIRERLTLMIEGLEQDLNGGPR